MKTNLLRIAFVAVGVAAIAGQALANPTLTVSSGGSTEVITLGSSLDLSSTPGVIIYSGAVGGWELNVDVATTKPIAGSAQSPFMDLSVIADSLTGSAPKAPLSIIFSETGFGPSSGNFFYGSIGTAASQIQAYYNTSDVLNAETTAIATGTLVPSTSPYSLTLVETFNPTTSLITSSNYLGVPDGGSTVALLGLGLGACGLIARRQKLV